MKTREDGGTMPTEGICSFAQNVIINFPPFIQTTVEDKHCQCFCGEPWQIFSSPAFSNSKMKETKWIKFVVKQKQAALFGPWYRLVFLKVSLKIGSVLIF